MYNFNDTPEFSENQVLEPGEYEAFIDSAQWEQSKRSPNNYHIKMVFDIGGRKIFEYLSLKSDNELAKKIGYAKTKSILLALGHNNFSFLNDDDLVRNLKGELILKIDTKTETYNGETRLKNIIKKWKPLNTKFQNIPNSTANTFTKDDIPF